MPDESLSQGKTQDWPQWRGPNRDAVSLEKDLLEKWPEGGPPLVWNSRVVNPPTDDGLGTSWSTVSIANGKFLWSYEGVAAVEGRGCIPTPIVQGDLVCCSGAYHGGASLARLVPDGNGGIQAKEEFHLPGKQLQVMHGGMVLVDGHIHGGHGHNGGFPFCLDLKTGKLDWKVRGAGLGSAGVVFADGDLYFRYENNVVALVEATPNGYRLRSIFQIGTGDPTFQERNSATNRELPGDLDTGWPHPVVVHGRFHIRAKDKVLCYDLRAGNLAEARSV